LLTLEELNLNTHGIINIHYNKLVNTRDAMKVTQYLTISVFEEKQNAD